MVSSPAITPAIQKDLIVLMGELGVLPEDLPRYVKDGYSLVTPAMTASLDALVKEIESQNVIFKGWQLGRDASFRRAEQWRGRSAAGRSVVCVR